jgi:hypothetical protein
LCEPEFLEQCRSSACIVYCVRQRLPALVAVDADDDDQVATLASGSAHAGFDSDITLLAHGHDQSSGRLVWMRRQTPRVHDIAHCVNCPCGRRRAVGQRPRGNHHLGHGDPVFGGAGPVSSGARSRRLALERLPCSSPLEGELAQALLEPGDGGGNGGARIGAAGGQ